MCQVDYTGVHGPPTNHASPRATTCSRTAHQPLALRSSTICSHELTTTRSFPSLVSSSRHPFAPSPRNSLGTLFFLPVNVYIPSNLINVVIPRAMIMSKIVTLSRGKNERERKKRRGRDRSVKTDIFPRCAI